MSQKLCRYVPFRFDIGSDVKIEWIIDKLIEKSDTRHKLVGRKRFLRIAKKDDYIIGRVLLEKDESGSHVTNVSTWKSKRNRLPKGHIHSCLNYFIFHLKSKHGLFQAYSGSNSFRDFGEICFRIAKEIIRPKKIEAKKHLKKVNGYKHNHEIPKEKLNKLDEQFRFNFLPVVSKKKLDEVLKNLLFDP